MRFPLTGWSPFRRRRPAGHSARTRPGRLDQRRLDQRRLDQRRDRRRLDRGHLDIARPVPHDMSDAGQARAPARIEDLVGRLQPGAIDAGSREVLNNLINSWMDQASARISRHQLEQTAVSAMLIGLAREEVARRRPRYEADYVRAQHARRTLAVTYQQLTGRELTDLPSPHPAHVDDPVVSSTLGATSWTDTGTPPGLVPAGLPGGTELGETEPGGTELGGTEPGETEPGGWGHRRLLLTEMPPLRDSRAARNGTAAVAPADAGDAGPDGI